MPVNKLAHSCWNSKYIILSKHIFLPHRLCWKVNIHCDSPHKKGAKCLLDVRQFCFVFFYKRPKEKKSIDSKALWPASIGFSRPPQSHNNGTSNNSQPQCPRRQEQSHWLIYQELLKFLLAHSWISFQRSLIFFVALVPCLLAWFGYIKPLFEVLTFYHIHFIILCVLFDYKWQLEMHGGSLCQIKPSFPELSFYRQVRGHSPRDQRASLTQAGATELDPLLLLISPSLGPPHPSFLGSSLFMFSFSSLFPWVLFTYTTALKQRSWRYSILLSRASSRWFPFSSLSKHLSLPQNLIISFIQAVPILHLSHI